MKYFPTLLRCVAVSLAALGVGMVAVGPTKWIGIAGAILPLIYYHLGYLRPRVASVADTPAIDSVYYYGFLVTVAALALSALSIDTTPPINLQPVLTKFGVGLAATGYAVLARMHLLSRVRIADGTSIDEMTDKYVRRSQALIDDVEVAIVRVKTFSETVLRESVALHEKTKSEFDEHLLGSARVFQAELNEICLAIRTEITQIGQLLNAVAFAAERSELNRLVNETAVTSRKLTEQMDGFGTQIRASSEKAIQATAAIGELGESIRDLDASIAAVGGPQGLIATAATNLIATADTSAKATQSAHDALAATGELAKKLGANEEAFAALLSFANTASAQLERLALTSANLDAALTQLSNVANTADRIAQDFAMAGYAFPKLGDEVQALTTTLDALRSSVSGSAKELEADVQRSAQATKVLIEGLTGVAEHIIERTRAHQGLAS